MLLLWGSAKTRGSKTKLPEHNLNQGDSHLMTTTLRTGFTLFLIALISAVFSYASAQTRNDPYEIWVHKKWDYAADGYDLTSYFSGDGAPVKGDPAYSATIANGTYLFTSQENLDAFVANPDAYLPQYGGHCAYALGARGFFVNGDPEVYHIKDGKLYFNLKGSIQRKWLKDKEGYITTADPRYAEKFPTRSPVQAAAATS